METKVCSKCKRGLPADKFHFYSANNTKDRLYSSCKECNGHKFSKSKIEIPEGHLLCKKCERILPATLKYFYRRKNGKFGLRNECKECEAICKKAYLKNNPDYNIKYHDEHKFEEAMYSKQYHESNKDKISEYNKQRYQKKRKEILGRTKKYYQVHKERYKENYRTFREEHKPEELERVSKWQKNNKEKGVLKSQRRRAKERQLESNYSEEEWFGCKNYFNNKCAYCGKKVKLTVEHVIPVNKGGSYIRQNIIPACGTCNRSKGDKDMELWYKKQPFYIEEREIKILEYLGIDFKNVIDQ